MLITLESAVTTDDDKAEQLLENSMDLLSMQWIVMNVENKRLHADIQTTIHKNGQDYQALSSDELSVSCKTFFEALFEARHNRESFFADPLTSDYVLDMAGRYPKWIENKDSIHMAPTEDARRYVAVMKAIYSEPAKR